MSLDIKPRSYIPGGDALHHAYEVMLRDHPEAFDVIVFPANPSELNEVNSVDLPEIGLLDRELKNQTYGEPFACRAIIAPEESLAFDMADSEMLEAFHGASEGINLLLSERGVRTFSIIQWLEYTDLSGTETTERTVYVGSTRPIGRTMNTWNVHTCFPLFNEGDIPEIEEKSELPILPPDDDQESGQDNDQDVSESIEPEENPVDTPSDIEGDNEEPRFDGYMEYIGPVEQEENQVGTL